MVGPPVAAFPVTLKVAPKKISLGSATLLPPNAVSVGPKTVTLTVNVKSGGPVNVLGVASDNPEFTVQHSCNYHPPIRLLDLAGGHFPITISFTPSKAGPRKGRITITTDAASPKHVAVRGIGKLGAADLTTTNLSFPRTVVGSATPRQTIKLVNQNPIALPAPLVSMTGPFSKTDDTCAGNVVAANGSCDVAVVFQPVVTSKATGSISFSDVVARSPQRVSLYSIGLEGPSASPTPTATATPSATPTATPSQSPTDTPTPTPIPLRRLRRREHLRDRQPQPPRRQLPSQP